MRNDCKLVLVAAALAALATLSGCSQKADAPPPFDPRPPALGPAIALAGGVTYEPLARGDGPALADGDWFAVHYTARIAAIGGAPGDPDPYDSTRAGEPFVAKLGSPLLLSGFAEGVRGMQRGERRRLLIPPAAAYGAYGKGRIPPDATLEYDVEIVDRFTRTASGLQYRVLAPGEGAPPTAGRHVTIEVIERLPDTGRLLFSSRDKGDALTFELGKGAAIPALEEALLAMAPRARWQLAVPPALGYGVGGHGLRLYPGQELIVDLELVRVAPPGP